jgi:hypothetical protein
MSTRPDLDRSITEWLGAEASDRAPERLLEASRERIRSTAQRRAWWPAWRVPSMNNTVRLIAVVAVVAIVAVIGYQFLFGSGVGDPGPSPSPSPSVEPSAAPSESSPAAGEPINFTDLEGEGTALEPGEYLIDYAAPVATVTFTVPDEPYVGWPSAWQKALFDWGPWHQSNYARLGAVEVVNLFVDPCNPALGLRDPAVGPSVDDLITALGEVPGLQHSAPVESTVGGLTGQYMELTGVVPEACVEDPSIWTTTHDDLSMLLPNTGDTSYVWIYDVAGQRLVIWVTEDAEFQDGGPGSPMEALLNSLVIEAP